MSFKEEFTFGTQFKTNSSGVCTVIKYENSKNVYVMFEDGTFVKASSSNIRAGSVKNPNKPNKPSILFGVGINDFELVHRHPSSERVGGKTVSDKKFLMWQAMLARSFSNYAKRLRPTYEDVSCIESWKTYSNFYKDISNLHGFDKALEEGWALDKDILIKGNKVYSPETCCFVPPEINGCFALRSLNRGDLPLGVSRNEYGLPYKARCRYDGKRISIGNYKTPEEAFEAYKVVKKKEILRLAEKWKGKIDGKVYEALIQWKIEITD